MKSSDFVAQYLEAKGVTHAFELVGGMITHLLDSLASTGVKIISCHHEQAAGFAAEGYSRISGVPGIALATSGPGATNLLTAIGSCYFDSTPAVFITGQVNTHELRKSKAVRQLGFQETDIVSMVKPICKSAVQVLSPNELPKAISDAFRLALEGRQGPCLIDIPMNVQSGAIDSHTASKYLNESVRPSIQNSNNNTSERNSPEVLQNFIKLLDSIQTAQRPLLLMGGGCATIVNRKSSRRIAKLLGVPVVLSLMAVDLLSESDPLRIGFIGSYGNRWANKALGAADLLIVIGSRLDIRQTGSDVSSFCEGKEIWHIDIDSAELGLRIQPKHMICCSIQSVDDHLSKVAKQRNWENSDWTDSIFALKRKFPAKNEYVITNDQFNPIHVIQELSKRTIGSCHYVTDVGQHQMWAAQSIRFGPDDRFLTSGGMGAMGFGLPAAIGASIARPDIPTVLITGDGSFQLNIQELETLRRNQLDIKIVLFNNRCHGMVRQFQETYFNGQLQSTVKGYSTPDFVSISKAYGISARHATPEKALGYSIDWLIKSQGPVLLEIPLSIESKAYPKLAFGRRFGEMEPEVSPIGMEST